MARLDHDAANRAARARSENRPEWNQERPGPKAMRVGGPTTTFIARHPGRCGRCGEEWNPGRTIGRAIAGGRTYCLPCLPKVKRGE